MNAPQSLRSLVESAAHRHSTSVRQLGELAKKEGYRIVYTTLGQIRNGTYKSVPSEETIRAIAWLAGVSDEVAFTAAGQPVPGPPLAEELPPGADNLSLKSRKLVVDMVRVLVDLEKSADNASNATAQEQSSDTGGAGDHTSDARPGQKTGMVRQLRAADFGDNNIPLPADYEQLAADSSHSQDVEQDHRWSGRGEESQESRK